MSADPSLLALVPCTASSTVNVKAALVHRCPHVEEVDSGVVAITWRCREMTVELHSLTAYLATWQAQKISHEEITEQIAVDLEALDGIEVESVQTTWTTAGMVVQVST